MSGNSACVPCLFCADTKTTGAYSRNLKSSRICSRNFFLERSFAASHLLTHRIIARPSSCAYPAMVVSSATMPSDASSTSSATLDIRKCLRAITTLNFSAISFVFPLRRMPAVSTKLYSMPSALTDSSTASRVVPATGETMERSVPTSAFSNVDLPTFGRQDGYVDARSHFGFGFFFDNRKIERYVCEEIVQAEVMFGRDGEEMFEAQRVKFVGQILAPRAVDFIDRERNRLPEFAEHRGEFAIRAGNLRAAVDQKNDLRRAVEGDSRLLQDLCGNHFGVVLNDSPGVDQLEAASFVDAFSVNAVAGDARLIANDGAALAKNRIE